MFNLFKKESNSKKETEPFGNFVGFFAAHGIWQVQDGENVIPLLSVQKNNVRNFERYEGESYEQALDKAKTAIKKKANDFSYSLLAYDGFITLNDEKHEAIIIEATDSTTPNSTISMAVPYRSAKSELGLAIYKPKVLSSTTPDLNLFLNDFWKGAESHTKAIEFWDKYSDQSI